ncbi:MAG: YceI family protein [Bacteroidetes bacterium]|nr:YceI family protein [Bacteroidota bacterium]MBU1680150.1 YceI family protein [Bacteroidota bacterium]MBU2506389.1 YceI family protein [Bacteroidota bacterium]
MKNLNKIFFLFLFTAGILSAQSEWAFDKAHSNVGFAVSHMVISETEGTFSEFEGSVSTKDDSFENAKIEFVVDINSIDTDNSDRDNHLKSDDFFGAAKYPKMTFKSKSFKKVDGKKYKLVGDLTIKDVTKEVVLDVKFNGIVKDPWGNTKAGFKLSGSLNRFDYGLKWSAALETGGLVVGEEVEITANIELAKK